jgi:RNA polymerase sigma factor (sigma-70 family)
MQPDDETPAKRSASSSEVRDWDAFVRLYDENEARLYRFARLLLPGQHALAEDAVAETFIKVHKAWVDGRVENFFGYARQTLVNHVLGLFRKQQTAQRYLTAVGPPGEHGSQMVDDQVVEAQAVFDALATLPDRRRTAVVLRYYEDLSYDEIAQMMDITDGAVKAHVSAGLAQLRALMTGAPP